MKTTLKFMLALGGAKMVILDKAQKQEIYAGQNEYSRKQEDALLRIAEAYREK